MSESDEILNPKPEQTQTKESVLTDRFDTLNGRDIGLLSNAKKNSDHFLRAVGERISTKFNLPVPDVIYKPTATSAAPSEIYEQISQYDAVLTAYGDCGSCSSWTIHDAIQLEKDGIPTVVFCSDEFTTLCQFEAESQACPELPIVEFEHPIADVDPEIVKTERVTEPLCDEVIRALTSSASELAGHYDGKYTGEL